MKIRTEFESRSIIVCVKEAIKVLEEDDFYVPNRAQLMIDFLQKHGDRVVKETPGPKKRFRSTLKRMCCKNPQHLYMPWAFI